MTATDRFPLDIVSTDAGANPHYLRYYRNSASPVADDYIGSLAFEGNDAAAARRTYAYFGTKIADTTANSLDGTFFINTPINNIETEVMTIKTGNVGIGTTAPGGKLEVAGQYFSTKYALTDGVTIALDWANGNVQSVTLGGNRTFTFANPKSGAVYTLILTQDATGSRTLTWPATAKWPGGVAPVLTTTASAVDILTFVSDGTNCYNIGFAADVK